AHISVVVGTYGGPLPFSLSIVDSQDRQLGSVDDTGKILKQIPFSDYFAFKNVAGDPTGQMALLVAPAPGSYTVRLDPVPGAAAPCSRKHPLPSAPGPGASRRHAVHSERGCAET